MKQIKDKINEKERFIQKNIIKKKDLNKKFNAF
jgi:hypothetical protein